MLSSHLFLSAQISLVRTLKLVKTTALIGLRIFFSNPSAYLKCASLRFDCALVLDKGPRGPNRAAVATCLRVHEEETRGFTSLQFLDHARLGLGLGM